MTARPLLLSSSPALGVDELRVGLHDVHIPLRIDELEDRLSGIVDPDGVTFDLGRRVGLVARRGLTDVGQRAPAPDGSGVEQLWRGDRIAALLAEHGAGSLFVAGCAANQVAFYDRFDAAVLLSASLDVLLERIATRTANPFGKDAAERERILQDVRAVEPLLRAAATVEVSTDQPIPEVADAVEMAAADASRRAARSTSR